MKKKNRTERNRHEMKLQLPCKHFSSLLYYNIIKWNTFCFQSETKQTTQK